MNHTVTVIAYRESTAVHPSAFDTHFCFGPETAANFIADIEVRVHIEEKSSSVEFNRQRAAYQFITLIDGLTEGLQSDETYDLFNKIAELSLELRSQKIQEYQRKKKMKELTQSPLAART